MPSRMVREGLLDSDPLRSAGEPAEILFTRLMLVADDYGRFDGRVTVICRRCWPLGGPSEPDVSQRLAALVREKLITLYESDGKPYIYLPKFNQRLRLKNPSKYPDPPGEGQGCAQMPVERPSPVSHPPDTRQADDRQMRAEVEVEVEVEVEAKEKRIPGVANSPESAAARGAALLADLKAKPPPLSTEDAKIDGGNDTPAAVLAKVLHSNGLRGNAFHPAVVEWARDGITVDRLKDAIARARQRPGKDKGTFGPEYLTPILYDESKPAAQVQAEKVTKAAAHNAEKAQRQIAEQRAMRESAAPMPESVRALLPKAAGA